MKIQKMKIPAILGALLLAGTLSAGAKKKEPVHK